MTIEIASWGHSAVSLQRAGRMLVVDPGALSDPAAIESADAMLFTHEDADHFGSIAALKDRLAANSDVQAWGPIAVTAQLRQTGVPAERVHDVTDGAHFVAAGFSVQAIVGNHAIVHEMLPVAAENVGYLVEDSVLHPGDAFTIPPEGLQIEALFLPISAPWLKLAEAVDYLHRVAPAHAIPIHDAFLSDSGRSMSDRIMRGLAQGIDYRRLANGERLSLTG